MYSNERMSEWIYIQDMGYSILNYSYSINRLLPHPIRWNPPASWTSNFQHRSPEMLGDSHNQ